MQGGARVSMERRVMERSRSMEREMIFSRGYIVREIRRKGKIRPVQSHVGKEIPAFLFCFVGPGGRQAWDS